MSKNSKRDRNSKKDKNSFFPKSNYMVLLCIQNILVATIDRVIVTKYNVHGAFLFLTIVLWIGMFRKPKPFFIVYTILSIFEAFGGLYAFVFIFLYIERGYDPTVCIAQAVLGCSYAISTFLLHIMHKTVDSGKLN